MAGGAVAEEAEEEPTEFNVTLKTDGGNKKIQAIKVVRGITGLGLAEAKKFVEGIPQVVKEGVEKEEADEIKKQVRRDRRRSRNQGVSELLVLTIF